MDTYTGNILDPIHGLIKLSEIEKWILSQRPFNRLRRIKQNTFLYLVFPSANHTRFEHSIGVMHLAHQIYIHANENFETGSFKKQKYNVEQTKGFEFITTKKLTDEKVLVQELRIAALLHDVGHGPMSHKFDQYTITGEQLFKILDSDSNLITYLPDFKELLKGKENEKIDHEIVSCVFIIKIISDLKAIANEEKFSTQNDIINKLNIKRIVKMIEPKFRIEDKIILDGLDYTDFFNSIISSFPIDADRMDYLYRDSYFSGVKYGLYDLSRLLMSFIPVKQDKKVSLCIKESGVDSIIRFIQSRTHLYTQVYFHKTNRAANAMLDFACQNIESTSPIIDAETYKEFEEFYWKNSDELFLWDTLQSKIVDTEAEVLQELLNRKLWKRVYENKFVKLPKGKNIEDELLNIKNDSISIIKDLNKVDLDVFFDYLPNKVFKDYKKSSIKIARKIDSNYIIEDDWKVFNKELEILDCEIYVVRIYLRRTFTSPEMFNSKKATVRTHFKDIIERLENLNFN